MTKSETVSVVRMVRVALLVLVLLVVDSLVSGASTAEACQVLWLVLMYQLACGRASVSSRQRFKIKLLFMQLTSWERKPK